MLGPVVSGSHPGDDPPHHPLSLHRPPLHPRQDDPPPGLRVAGRLGRPGDVQGLPEQVQEGGVQLEGPGPGQAAGGGGQQDGSQQRGNQHLVMRQDKTSLHNTLILIFLYTNQWVATILIYCLKTFNKIVKIIIINFMYYMKYIFLNGASKKIMSGKK